MQDDEYEHESECEDYADYGIDGYHPVTLGIYLLTMQDRNSTMENTW